MNSEKILIEIRWPAIDQAYDCMVPRKITVKDLYENFLGILEDLIGIRYGDTADMMLMSGRTGTVLQKDHTLDEEAVDSGDTLFIL